jgi:preprotein translocase SecE subunit
MARDRQRAKQRRRRGTSGPPPGSTRARARDAKQAAPEPAEATPAPEPTEQAQPYVDEARMAEAGVPVPEPQDEADLEPDELDAEDGAYAAADPAVVEERAEAARRRPRRGRVLTFLGHVVDELRRVQWPDRRQTAQGTAVTLGFVVIAGGFLGLMDAIWQPIIEAIL